jgi:putative ABC transport system permease protein
MENFRIALRALSSNKLRSGLTMLGIIIGVGAVVALMALGAGATASITSSVQGIGSNLLTVAPARIRAGNTFTRSYLYYVDYQALLQSLGSSATLAPVYQTNATVTYGNQSSNTSVAGTSPEYAAVREYTVQVGRFLTADDNNSEARVAVLGSQTALDLFQGLSPLGRSIIINGTALKVVGVLQSKGTAGFGNQDDIVLVPIQTDYSALLGGGAMNNGKWTITNLFISAASSQLVNPVTNQATLTIRTLHQLKPEAALDVTISSQTAILSTLSTITGTLTGFLGFIAAISLFVGGIGVMNIMLVSVTERTREIGLRKAVGARRSNILSQFLIETLTLTLLGGTLGVIIGWSIADVVKQLGIMQTQVTVNSIIMAFAVTLAVGVLSGLYPAFRASRLRPIEALRYE